MSLLHRHLQIAIREGVGEVDRFFSVLSALRHFNPPQVAVIRELWLSWMTEILSSRYEAWERCVVAGEVVELAREHIKREMKFSAYNVDTAWLPPLLGFLRLGEEVHWEGSPTPPGVFALRILSHSKGSDLGPTIIPILTSTLRSTHPLQSRKTALKAFCQHGFGWLSSQMENVSSGDRVGLLHAVDDPFRSTPDGKGRYALGGRYNPMSVATILIELASSDLWRSHLRRSNFVSCEEVISTAEGRKSAFECLKYATKPWPFLCTPAKVISAIECLEALRCPHTIEVVLAFIWASRGVDEPPIDLDGWRLIHQKTLAFYRTRGIGRLKVLSQHITANRISSLHDRDPRCRVEGVRLPVRIATEERKWGCMEDWYSDMRLAQVCQRKMLYQLFGCNPAAWEEMLAADSEEANEWVDVSVGQPGVSARFMYWACDYP